MVAADGSQIAPSHHEVIPAFLLNIATVVLHYGTGERAEFSSTPTLFYREEDLYTDLWWTAGTGGGRDPGHAPHHHGIPESAAAGQRGAK